MQPDHFPSRRAGAGVYGPRLALAFVAALCGCAAPAEPEHVRVMSASSAPGAVSTQSAGASAAAPAAATDKPDSTPGDPVEVMLMYADRVRNLPPAELAQEISRLGNGGDSAAHLVRLGIALAQSKVAANGLRAQALLQRVLGQNEQEARVLHPLVRLLSVQLAETRRAEEQIERQNQQLRDAQRRIEQLTDRLEAVRAIERSLPSRPASGAAAPAHPRP